MKKLNFLLMLILLSTISYGAVVSSSSINWLSKIRADSLYCQLGVGCDQSAGDVAFFYGEMFNHSHDGDTITLPALNQYVNITGFLPGNLSSVVFSNNALVPSQAGFYKIDWALSFGGGATREYQMAVAINETTHEKCEAHRMTGTGGDVGSASGTCILPLSIGDNVRLVIRTITNPVANPVIYIKSLNLVRLQVPLANISTVDTVWSLNPPWLYNNSGNLDFNETLLNATIDARDTGATTFLELTDTPSTYISQAGKTVKVNGLGSALEFVTSVIDTKWSIVSRWFFNNSGSLDFNETRLNQSIDSRIPIIRENVTVLLKWNNTDFAMGTTSRTYLDAINLSKYNTTDWKALRIHGQFYKIFSGKQEHNIQIWNCSGDPIETMFVDTNPSGLGLDAQTIYPTITHTVHSDDFCFDGLYHFRYQHISGTEGVTKKYTSYEAII